MGSLNPFSGAKKAAKKQAAATMAAANMQAEQDAKNTLAIKESAELTAAATRDAANQAAEAAARQEAQITANATMAQESMLRQEKQLADNAAASKEAQAKAEQNARDQAQAFQQQKELTIAMDIAKDKAQESLTQVPDSVEVTLASEKPDAAEIDPVTGRRRPRRAQFMSNGSAGGLQI